MNLTHGLLLRARIAQGTAEIAEKAVKNGYKDQINITNPIECSYCYSSHACVHEDQRHCMKQITVDKIMYYVRGLSTIHELTIPGRTRHIKDRALEYCKGEGIDVGAGPYVLPGARAVDRGRDEHATLIKAEDATLNYVYSSHCMVHLDDPYAALVEWSRVLKRKGVLFLYLPHPYYLPWRAENLVGHKRDLYPDEVQSMVRSAGFDVVVYEEDDGHFSQTLIATKR